MPATAIEPEGPVHRIESASEIELPPGEGAADKE
jgi:hypothetical protein